MKKKLGESGGQRLFYGWLENAIWSLVRWQWPVFQELPYCLVTCIDSTYDVKSILSSGDIKGMGGFYTFLGNGLLVHGGRIGDMDLGYHCSRGCNLFNGFDEVWLYKDQPTLEKPTAVSIVPPPDFPGVSKVPPPDSIQETPSKELLEWFNASGCVLGLGDGTGMGMNYITTSRQIHEFILGNGASP